MAENDITNFKRKEKKYLLSEDQYKLVKEYIKANMDKDAHFRSIVSNVYYDTDDYRLINRSIEKPLYKEKLRIRTYLSDNWNGYTFAEMKKKYNGIVYKRRIGASYKDIMEFLKTASCDSWEKALEDLEKTYDDNQMPYGDKQIAKEIAWMSQRYKIKPKLWIGYVRNSYRDKGNGDLRITFDQDIIYRTDDLNLKRFDGEKLFNYPYCLMEIKTAQGTPMWLNKLLSENKIYPYSFSKCGRIYKDKIFNNNIENNSEKNFEKYLMEE